MSIERKVLRPEGIPHPSEPFSQAISVNAGRLLFVSGQLAVDENGDTVGGDDIAAQMEQVFHNLKCALSSAGATFQNVVKFTTFLVRGDDLGRFFEKRREVFSEIFPDGEFPTNTLVVVDRLPKTEWLIEVEAIASLP